MDIELSLTFLGASILLALMPGPDNIFVMTESLTRGQKYGISISLGLVSGVMIHTLIAATGLSIIIKNSEPFFQIVKYLGVTYLFYLAYMSTKEKQILLNLDGNNSNKFQEFYFWGLFRKGFLMNVLNPKVTLFFIAFLPQFIAKESGLSVTIQMIILGLIFMMQTLVVFSTISILSGKLTRYLNSPKFWKITKVCKVSVLTLLGLFLLISDK